jgi:small subunit ribosomal protein S3
VGHKTHPIGFRLGVIKGWQSRWIGRKGIDYAAQVQEDLKIRKTILDQYSEAGISKIEVERSTGEVSIDIHTARPGIVIGRGGARVDELRKTIEKSVQGKRVRLNVVEIRQPDQVAYLVARNIADQIERRVAYRRAMRQAVTRTMNSGALGIKVNVSGRLGGTEIARRDKAMEGRVPLHTLRANIDYGLAEAHTVMGRIGVKVWLYLGDVLKEVAVKESEEEIRPVEVTFRAGEDLEQNAATEEN